MAEVKAIPDGYGSVTPYLIVPDGAGAVAFYQRAFGAGERMRLTRPDGRIGHAEVTIGNSVIMLADEHPEIDAKGPAAYGGSPVSLHVYVENVDQIVARAVSAGAELIRPVENQFYGDRSGSVTDPFGHIWHIATHIEDVSPQEIDRRAIAAMQKREQA